MKVISFAQHGPPNVLQVIEKDIPTPKPQQVIVHNHAIGVNFVDVLHRQGGRYAVVLPLIPGIEAAGVVYALGDGVTDVKIGDRVAYAGYMGGNYADYTPVDADQLIPLPDAVSFEVAAATILQGMTAYCLTNIVYPVKNGDWVLIHAAAGGMGSLLTQCAVVRGATVVGTVSTQAKADFARENGAQHVIRYTQQDFANVTNDLTNDAGVSAVFDAIGQSTFEGSMACLAKRGMLVIYGQSSGAIPPIDINRLSGITPNSGRGSQFITWAALSHYTETRDERLTMAAAVFQMLQNGTMQPNIADRLPLEDAQTAHEMLEARTVIGKLLLIPDAG